MGAEVTVAAIVAAGGRGSRLGGVDKPAVEVGGKSMRARVVEACVPVLGAGLPVVVVGASGPDVNCYDSVVCVREEPEYAGPVAAVARGLREVGDASHVLLLGGDMPRLTSGVLAGLVEHGTPSGVWTLGDGGGRLQFLCAVWPVAVLRDALDRVRNVDGGLVGVSMKRLYGAAGDMVHVWAPGSQFAADAVRDIDDLADLEDYRADLRE